MSLFIEPTAPALEIAAPVRPTVRAHVQIARLDHWIKNVFVLPVVGVTMGYWVSPALGVVLIVLWVMGCIYTIPPLRAKDVPYVDVLTESVNNPLRMLAGWYLVTSAVVPPVSLLLSYWMVG